MPEINIRGGGLLLPAATDSFGTFNDLVVGAVRSYDPRGILPWAQSLSRGSIRVGPQLALSGQGINAINAGLDAWLPTLPAAALTPYIFYDPGHNDLGGSMTAAEWLAAHEAGRNKILASGRTPICVVVIPNTTAPAVTAARVLFRLQINAGLLALRAQGFPVFDYSEGIQGADGTIPTRVLPDGTHLGTYSAFIAGKKLWRFMEPLLTPIASTEWAPVGKTGMRVLNGVMNGGTTAPTGWTLTGGVGSKVAADPDDTDQTPWAQFAITSSGGRAYGGLQATLANVAGNLVSYLEMEVTAPDDASVINGTLEIRSFAGGNPQRQCVPGVNAGEFYPAGKHRMVLITPPVEFTSAERASSFIYATGSVADAKSGTFKVRRVGDLES